MPKATVVIPVLNGGDLLLAVLAMACSQAADFDYDVLVIDSGSTDLALRRMREMAEEGAIRLIEIPKEEFGHGKTRNLGVQNADSDFVAFLTQDALPVDRYWLQRLVGPMLHDDTVAGVFGRHYAYPSSGEKMKHDLECFMQGFDRGPEVSRMPDRAEYDASIGLRQFLHFYSDNNSCLRKAVWKAIPYRDVQYGEDQIWAREIIEAGYAKAYAREAGVYHSHNYGLIDTFRRSRVDRKFWVQAFGYTSVTTLRSVFAESRRQSRDVLDWYKENRFVPLSLKEKMSIVLNGFAVFYGEYRGYGDARREKNSRMAQ